MNYVRIGVTCLAVLGTSLIWDGLPFGFNGKFAVIPSQVLAQSTDPKQVEADRLIEQGNQQFSRSQFREALEFYQQALVIYRSLNNRNGEAISLGNLGNAYYSLGQYQKAIEYSQQSLAIKQQIGDRKG